jgi:hypothetical protein
MAITCCIRYVLDPFKRDAFEDYARRWANIGRAVCEGHSEEEPAAFDLGSAIL